MALDLGKQVGPLPLGAWIAVVGGGLGIAVWARQKSTAPTIVDDTSGQPGVGDGSVGGWTPTTPPSTSPGTGDSLIPTTNEGWAVQGINWLIAQGYDAAESDSAIRKYIAGNDPAPSVKEYVLQGLVLQHFGSPPQPLPPATNPPPVIPKPTPTPTPTPTTPPKPVPSPTKYHWWTVTPWPTKGSTLSGIAQMAYGSAAQWPRIYNANRVGVRRPDGSMGMIQDPNKLHTGWHLVIPL